MAAPEGNKFAEGEGRPTLYKQEYDAQAYKLCLLGATDKDLANFFEVCEATINNWKIENESFLESIKDGKVKADAIIAESLFKRAKGAIINKQQAFKVRNSNGKEGYTESIEIVDLIEEIPPDTTAIKFWLSNRKSSDWKEKVDLSSSDGSMTPKVLDLSQLSTEELLLRANATNKLKEK